MKNKLNWQRLPQGNVRNAWRRIRSGTHTHTHIHPLPCCPLCQPPLVSSAAAQKQKQQQQLEWQTTTGNDQRAVAATQRHQNHCHGLRRNCRANLTLTLKRSRSSRDWGRGRSRVGLLSLLWNNFSALLWLGLGYAGRTWQDSKTSCIYRQRRRRRRRRRRVQRIRNRKRKK